MSTTLLSLVPRNPFNAGLVKITFTLKSAGELLIDDVEAWHCLSRQWMQNFLIGYSSAKSDEPLEPLGPIKVPVVCAL